MHQRIFRQNSGLSKSSSTPAPNPFQSRPFAPAHQVSPQPQETADSQQQQEQPKGSGYNFANVGITPRETNPLGVLQRKLTIGAPGDGYEREAERVAAEVVQQKGETVKEKNALSQSVSQEKTVIQRYLDADGNSIEEFSSDNEEGESPKNAQPEKEEYEADDEWEQIKNNPKGRFADQRPEEERAVNYIKGSKARFARRMRRRYAAQEKPISHTRNLATVKTRNKTTGRVRYTTRASEQQGKRHSEKVIAEMLKNDPNFKDHEVVDALYTERAGCGVGRGFQNCRGTSIPDVTGSDKHYSTVDHPDQRDYMSDDTLEKWRDGRYKDEDGNATVTQDEKQQIAQKGKKANTQAAAARDILAEYLSDQFKEAEQQSESDPEAESSSESSYSEWSDSNFGVDPTGGAPKTKKRKHDSDDDYQDE